MDFKTYKETINEQEGGNIDEEQLDNIDIDSEINKDEKKKFDNRRFDDEVIEDFNLDELINYIQ